ncbi:hypothetical protein [Nostoc sp.]|uniref:hypothetical protein n=1 Tax=Nostoc sp. TaxID=1180 RepID=UPI002FF8B68C
MNYIKTQIPLICDPHAERLAAQVIAALPQLFTENPEIFSKALLIAGNKLNADVINQIDANSDWAGQLTRVESI